MADAYLDIGAAAAYFATELLLPAILAIFAAFIFWRIQSAFVLHSYYLLILPELRQNRILYHVLGGAAVASHEILGHALVGVTTGSDAVVDANLTPESGRVRIAHKVTAWGYLSSILATLAPCFAPPAIIILAFVFLFPANITFGALDLPALISEVASNFASVLGIIFNSDLTNPAAQFAILLLSALSMTAGASTTDFRIISLQTRRYWHFALFLLLAFAAALEAMRVLLNLPSALNLFFPAASLLLLSFLTVLLGICISLAFAAYLRFIAGFPFYLKLISFAAFPASYVGVLYTPISFPLPYYISVLLASLFAMAIWTAFLRLAFSSLAPKQPQRRSRSRRVRMRSLDEYERE